MKESDSKEIPPLRFHCIDAIEISLCIEKQGLVYYEKSAKKVKDPKVQDIFLRLAAEEKEHIQSLQSKAGFLQPALKTRSASRKHVDQMIAELVDGKVFPGTDDPSVPDTLEFKSDLEALEIGIASEKRSIEVLSNLLQTERKIDVRVIFSHLLAEEKKHLASLEALKRTLVSQKAQKA